VQSTQIKRPLRLKHVLAHCPELAVTAEQVNDFAQMMTNLEGHRLTAWIEKTETIAPAPLQSFARHLRQDLAAVTAGLTLRWNSGPVEGHANRIKYLKRQGYGRAGLRLLCRRVLLTP
jgi:transposase